VVARFEDVVEAARKLVNQPLAFSLDRFIRIVEEYVEGLPEQLKESYVGYFSPTGSKVVKRRDLPRVLREDPDFRDRFIRMLASG